MFKDLEYSGGLDCFPDDEFFYHILPVPRKVEEFFAKSKSVVYCYSRKVVSILDDSSVRAD